jgi:hypothetical protein
MLGAVASLQATGPLCKDFSGRATRWGQSRRSALRVQAARDDVDDAWARFKQTLPKVEQQNVATKAAPR